MLTPALFGVPTFTPLFTLLIAQSVAKSTGEGGQNREGAGRALPPQISLQLLPLNEMLHPDTPAQLPHSHSSAASHPQRGNAQIKTPKQKGCFMSRDPPISPPQRQANVYHIDVEKGKGKGQHRRNRSFENPCLLHHY